MSKLEMNLQKGLVGHWTMDDSDTSGGTLYDSSANDNNGNIEGATSGIKAEIGQALEFNGSSDHAEVADADSLNVGVNMTVTAWVNPDSLSSNFVQVASHYGGTGWLMRLNDSTVAFQGRTGTGTYFKLNASHTLPTNEWTHICIRRIGSEWYVIVNGEVIQVATKDDGKFVPNDPIQIAYYNNDFYFDGKISNIRVYSRALSEDEISALYNMRSQRNASI